MMDQPTMESLGQRLDRVERQNQRLMRIGAVALAVIAAVVLMGQATATKVAKVIEAEKFVLRDPQGKHLALLGTKKGSAILGFFDTSGNMAAGFGLLPDGSAGLHLYDQFTNPRIVLSVTAAGLASLVLADKESRHRASLTVGAEFGEPKLTLYDKAGTTRAQLRLGDDGDTVTLSVHDKAGNARALLGSTPFLDPQTGEIKKRPESSLLLVDKGGKARALFGSFSVVDPRTGVVEERGKPPLILVLSDETGKVNWSAP